MRDIMRIHLKHFKHAYSFISAEGEPSVSLSLSLSLVLENSAESKRKTDSPNLSPLPHLQLPLPFQLGDPLSRPGQMISVTPSWLGTSPRMHLDYTMIF